MPSLLDRIRTKMRGSFVTADDIRETKDDSMDTTGITFKSFDEVSSKKANAEWAQQEPKQDMFGFAASGLPEYPHDENDDPETPESALKRVISITPEDYDVDSNLVPPRPEWVQKKQQAQQAEEMQQGSPEMAGRTPEEGYY